MTDAIQPGFERPENNHQDNAPLQAYLGAESIRLVNLAHQVSESETLPQPAANEVVRNLGLAARHLVEAQQGIVGRTVLLPLIPAPMSTGERDLQPSSHIASHPKYQPTFEDDLVIAARRVTVQRPGGWRGGKPPAQPISAREIIASLSPEVRQTMRDLWPTLNAAQRRAYVLSKYFNLNDEHIARNLNVSPKTVNSLLADAHKLEVQAKKSIRKQPPRPRSNGVRPLTASHPERAAVEMMRGAPINLSKEPLIEVYWEDGQEQDSDQLNIANTGKIYGIRLGDARIHVQGGKENSPQYEKCMVLATVGLSNVRIAKLLYVTEDTVKTHMRRAFEKYGVPSRAALAIKLLEKKAYTIETAHADLEWTVQEKQVCVGIAQGLSNEKIAEHLYKSPAMIKQYVRSLMKKNGFSVREQIALATLSSIPEEILLNS